MNAIDFIRHHTRLILEDEIKDKEKKDNQERTSKAVRIGRISDSAKNALGLAESNPMQLLKNLGISNYKSKGINNLSNVFDFLNTAIKSNTLLGIAFEKPTTDSNYIDLPVFLIAGSVPAIKQTQAPRYIKAMLLAANILKLIEFDIEKKNSVVLRSISSDEENEDLSDNKQYFVRVIVT